MMEGNRRVISLNLRTVVGKDGCDAMQHKDAFYLPFLSCPNNIAILPLVSPMYVSGYL